MPTKKSKPSPMQPSAELVRRYTDKFYKSESDKNVEIAIGDFMRHLPANTELFAVLAKVCMINDLLVTRLFKPLAMAQHILSLKIDQPLLQGSAEIVDKIAHLTISDSTRCNFSFATKYCASHSPGNYPMFDKNVRRLLLAYRDKDKFSKFAEADLRQYPKFKVIVISFRQYYGLTGFSFRELDHFLWGYGKELFPAPHTGRNK